MTLKQDAAEGSENVAGSPRCSASSPARGRAVGYRIRGSQGRLIRAIGEMIVSGEVAPGQLLPREAEIMELFEVSRTTVREAKGLGKTRQPPMPAALAERS